MIKTKAGQEVRILEGNKKCINGVRPFVVELVYPEITPEEIYSNPQKLRARVYKKLKLRKTELVYDDINELYEAIGVKMENTVNA